MNFSLNVDLDGWEVIAIFLIGFVLGALLL
jgi:hypothetical protein